MLTRVEISGFKSFVDFQLSLRPFQIIAGPNAAGKSNFFDALQLLSRLAEHDLRTAFLSPRGEALEQFTSSGPDKMLASMRFAIEAVVPGMVKDQWGEEAELQNTHLRYVLELTQAWNDGRRQIRITEESLTRISKDDQSSLLPFAISEPFRKTHIKRGSRAEPYIATEESGKIVLHQDGRAGRKREFNARDLESTILGAATSVTFKHAFAMRQELTGIRFLQLEPTALRQPSPKSPFPGHERLQSNGENLPAVLARLQNTDPALLTDLAMTLRNVIPDIKGLDIWDDTTQKRLVARGSFDTGGPYPAGLLSDGTLRLLALASLAADPNHEGTICFEEPENGVHPERMKGLLNVLHSLATAPDTNHEGTPANEPLRQLIVNTHSPTLLSLAEADELLFAVTRRHYSSELEATLSSSVFMPVNDELPLRSPGTPRTSISRKEVRSYLESVHLAAWENGHP